MENVVQIGRLVARGCFLRGFGVLLKVRDKNLCAVKGNSIVCKGKGVSEMTFSDSFDVSN
jgi:hypothetical protein